MQSAYFVLLVTALAITCSQGVNITAKSHVVMKIKQNVEADCVLLVTSSIEEGTIVATTGRLLSSNFIPMASLKTSQLESWHQKLGNTCNRPMFVFFSDSLAVRAQLMLVSKKSQMSLATWLMFLNENDTLQDIFLDINIPFDCEFFIARAWQDSYRLSEVYRVAPGLPLQLHGFGWWGPTIGFKPRDAGFYTRRNSLEGLVLKTTNEHDPPISVLTTSNNKTQLGGFSGMVWKIFERRMNFSSVHTVYVSNGSSNAMSNTSTSDEMITAVLSGGVHMTASAITMTPDTSEVVAFMFPLFTIYSRIFIRPPDGREVAWDNFLAPFSTSLWIAFLITSLVTAALLSLLYHVVRAYDADEERYSLYDAIFLVFGAIFCQQGHERPPRSVSCRIVHILMYITAVIAVNSYSGSIISNLTVFHYQMPFQNLRGLHAEGSFTLGMLKNSFVYNMFKNPKQTFVGDLYSKHIESNPRNTPKDSLEGFVRACNEKFAFISTVEAESVRRDEMNCTLVYLPEHFVKFSASLAFPKNSPYRGLFNHNLLKLANSGVISNLYKGAVPERLTSSEVELMSIDLHEITPILSIMIGGIVLGIVFLMLENLLMFVIKKVDIFKLSAKKGSLESDAKFSTGSRLMASEMKAGLFGRHVHGLKQRNRGNIPGFEHYD